MQVSTKGDLSAHGWVHEQDWLWFYRLPLDFMLAMCRTQIVDLYENSQLDFKAVQQYIQVHCASH